MHATANAAPLVLVRGATKIHAKDKAPVVALAGVDLEVLPGEFVALVGPSGCGKSTLLNLLSGVDRPDEGAVRVGGLDLRAAGDAQLVDLRRRVVGIVFQSFHLVPHLTVEENVALPLALAGRSDATRVRALLEAVGLQKRAAHYPGELSGGEQQRTAVARAVVHKPAIVLADEPTGNLDSAAGASVLELLDQLRRESGSALLLVTHDAALAARADRVVRLKDGRVAPPSVVAGAAT
ncbi:MAG: ABC transporter ATP-binding protein [Planctomycetia bacterium]